MSEPFSLNPDLDLAAAAEQYALDRRIRIRDFLAPESAQALSDCLANETPWSQAFFLDNRVREEPVERLRSLSAQDQRRLLNAIHAQAAQGIGYWYGRHSIGENSPPTLREFTEWLNSEPLLEAIRTISGCSEISSAAPQGSRFLPGDFLTRHRDTVDERKRKLAFVFNLSAGWHPDWGGLLQFYETDGTLRDAWTPAFNSLSLFDVEHIHSVSAVAPFAARPRLAVSGWFRLI